MWRVIKRSSIEGWGWSTFQTPCSISMPPKSSDNRRSPGCKHTDLSHQNSWLQNPPRRGTNQQPNQPKSKPNKPKQTKPTSNPNPNPTLNQTNHPPSPPPCAKAGPSEGSRATGATGAAGAPCHDAACGPSWRRSEFFGVPNCKSGFFLFWGSS